MEKRKQAKRRKKPSNRNQIDIFGQLSSASELSAWAAPPATAPAAAPEQRRGFLEVVETFRLSRPICVQVDFAGEVPDFAVVDEHSGEQVTALKREEFLHLLGH